MIVLEPGPLQVTDTLQSEGFPLRARTPSAPSRQLTVDAKITYATQ